MELSVGQQFSSYLELQNYIKKYENNYRQKFSKKRSRTLQTASKMLTRSLKESLQYYELEYTCVHGEERAKKGNGFRQSSTMRLGCKVYFKLWVSSSGEYLEIISANLEHTEHELSQTVFEHLPQNRGLDDNEKGAVETYLSLGGNKKKIQDKIRVDTAKKTTLKDLHNIGHKLKIMKNNLDEAVNLLKNKYGCNVHVLADEEGNFKALQFTNEKMRNTMTAWPEFLSIDGTYKLLDIGCTLFLFLVEDSNGQSEIVSASLLSVEDRDVYCWLFNTFRAEMQCNNIKCFMGDKDLLERNVIKEIFPGVPVYLCVFHTLKTFRREICCDKLNISREERDLSLEYLQKLTSEAEYDLLYEQFKECVPQIVSNYFDRNWHVIRDEWLICNMSQSNFKNITNNRMESINSKIKQVVPKNSSLLEFIKNFFVFLDSQQQERDHKAANHILKKPRRQFDCFENDLNKYLHFLTSYGFDYVHKEMLLLDKISFEPESGSDKFTLKTTSGRKILVGINTCSCNSFSSMLLSCRHIFALRVLQNIPLFDTSLCNIRWSKDYYLSSQRIGASCSGTISEPTISSTCKPKIMSLTEKRKAATIVANSLINLVSLGSNSDFNYKMDVLKQLEKAWRAGKEVCLDFLNPDVEKPSVYEKESLEEQTFVDDSDMPVKNFVDEGKSLGFNVTEFNDNTASAALSVEEELKLITLPSKIKLRGRPRGSDATTTIGLKKKETKKFQ